MSPVGASLIPVQAVEMFCDDARLERICSVFGELCTTEDINETNNLLFGFVIET